LDIVQRQNYTSVRRAEVVVHLSRNMIDLHSHPASWGIRPILFQIGNVAVSSYAFFVALGLAVGLAVYFFEAKRQHRMNENGFMIAFGALLGGTIGAKLLVWAINYQYLVSHFPQWEVLLSGRSIVGGLIGGSIGAIITKRILKIKEKRGNLFAPAIAIGVAIGRLGCFFQGCCYGKSTSLPWGVDFGDGIMRHPTQLYESLFMFAMFVYLQLVKSDLKLQPGQLFKRLMIMYFVFRFLIEFIRVEGELIFGLSVFQVISIGAIIYLSRVDIKKFVIASISYGKS
jgi:phosphatidylglycerol---prolipoprotein diacylglyceryl transferase